MTPRRPGHRLCAALRRGAADTRGAAGVEAVILFPVLILMGFGAVDGALLVQQTHRMEAGLGAAGAYLAQGGADAVQQRRARRIAVTGQGRNGGTPVLPGWKPRHVSVSIRTVDNANGDYRARGDVRVAELSSSIPYEGFGILSRVAGGSLSVSARHEVRLAE